LCVNNDGLKKAQNKESKECRWYHFCFVLVFWFLWVKQSVSDRDMLNEVVFVGAKSVLYVDSVYSVRVVKKC